MSFFQFAESHGLVIRSIVHGRITRCPTIDKPRKRNGAYLYNGEFGWVQNWGTMDAPEVWHDGKERTPEEYAALAARIQESNRKNAQQIARKQRAAAEKAKWILGQCYLDSHHYLERKGFKDAKGNIWRKGDAVLLVIPMHYRNEICGCQLINDAGEKKFLTGQRTNDAYFKIGNGREFIVEGYASGLSLNAILGALKIPASVYVCFSAGNASRVAKTLPNAFWIADNDASGTGQNAAAESGLKWWMPPETGMDVNDFHQRAGLFKASQAIRKILLTA